MTSVVAGLRRTWVLDTTTILPARAVCPARWRGCQNGGVSTDLHSPLVLVVGRVSPEAKNVRGLAFAAGRTYFHAVERAGGTPLMLPPIPELVDRIPALVERVDAIVLHGGGDVDPRRYGEEPTAEQLYGIVHEHDEVELAVVQAALVQEKPMLAICRGMQVLNVALGGTLQQHIGSDDHWLTHHPVQVAAGSRLAKAIGGEVASSCHSVHHQAVAQLGSGLSLVASTADGMPEAVELDGASWTVAVQWHPEDTAGADGQQQALFDELIRQAR
jgi:putative glutamine amidotransferase